VEQPGKVILPTAMLSKNAIAEIVYGRTVENCTTHDSSSQTFGHCQTRNSFAAYRCQASPYPTFCMKVAELVPMEITADVSFHDQNPLIVKHSTNPDTQLSRSIPTMIRKTP